MPMTTPLGAHVAPRPDAIRILGISSAIAMNLIAAGLLLMPMQALPPAAPPDPTTVWIIPAATPPAPLPPPRIAVPRPATATPAPVARPAPAPVPADPPAVVAEGPPQASVPVGAEATPGAFAAAPATTGAAPMQLEYAIAPAPPYPRESLRNGDEGLVLLQVLVDVDGRPLEVVVVEGSGHRILDRAARRHVLAHWRFRPAVRDGQAVRALGLVPIEFSLD